jgi:hypothetical protein
MRTNKLRFSSLVSLATLPSFIQFNVANATNTAAVTLTEDFQLPASKSDLSSSSSSSPPPTVMRRQQQKRHSTRLDAVVGCANTFINRKFPNKSCQKRLTNKTSKHDAMRHRSCRVYSDTLMYASSMIEDEEFNFNLSQYLIENDDDDGDHDHEALDKISMTLRANYDIEQDEDYLSTNGMYLYDNDDEDNDECHVSTASSVCTIATLDSFLSKLQEQHIISNDYDCEAVVNVRTKQRRNANNDQEVQDSRMMMRSRKAISTNDLIHNFKLKSNNRNENEVYIYIYMHREIR